MKLYKKCLFIIFGLLLAGCMKEESRHTDSEAKEIVGEIEEEVKTVEVEAEELEVESEANLEEEREEIIEVDVSLLLEKVWSDPSQEFFVKFNEINQEGFEFMILSNEKSASEEQIVTGEIQKLTETTAKGIITDAYTVEDYGQSEYDNQLITITLHNDSLNLSIDRKLEIDLEEISVAATDWESLKKSNKEISETEVFALIQQAEQLAIESFGAAFTETDEGFVFTKPLHVITEGLEKYYSNSYLTDEMKSIYDNPVIIYEPLYAFPFTEVPVDNYLIDKSDEQIDVYYEGDFYGDPTLYHYKLIFEDDLWKISLQESLLTPAGAESAVRMVEGYFDENVYVEIDTGIGKTFDEYIHIILDNRSYPILAYVMNEHSNPPLGWYVVNPRTQMVYMDDVISGERIELGTPY